MMIFTLKLELNFNDAMISKDKTGDVNSYHECDFGEGFELTNTLVLNPC